MWEDISQFQKMKKVNAIERYEIKILHNIKSKRIIFTLKSSFHRGKKVESKRCWLKLFDFFRRLVSGSTLRYTLNRNCLKSSQLLHTILFLELFMLWTSQINICIFICKYADVLNVVVDGKTLYNLFQYVTKSWKLPSNRNIILSNIEIAFMNLSNMRKTSILNVQKYIQRETEENR